MATTLKIEIDLEDLRPLIEAVVQEVLSTRPAEEQREVFTRDQAAEYLKISVRTVDTMLKEGHLACTRFGRRVRISRAELDRVSAEGSPVRSRKRRRRDSLLEVLTGSTGGRNGKS